LDQPGCALVLGGDRTDLDLDDAAVLVALDLLELGAGHARGDALDVGEHGPRPIGRGADPELVVQLHCLRSSTVSTSAGSPSHATSATRSARSAINDRAPSSPV